MADAPTLAAPGLAPVPPTQPLLRACLFTLGGSPYAVDVLCAREVAVFDEITVVPRAPSPLLGVANLRGTVMPIVDIRPLLGLSVQRFGRGMRALVIHSGGIQAAVAVEAVLGLEPFEEIVPLIPGGQGGHREYDLGLLRWDGGLVTLLDAPAILAALAREMRGGDRPERGVA